MKFVEMAASAPAPTADAPPTDGGTIDHNRIIEEIRSAFDAEVIDTTEKE
jgi:hypothetical protein